MKIIEAVIHNVTVTKVTPGRYRELYVEWELPTTIVGDPTTAMSLSLYIDPQVIVGDTGKLVLVDGYWKFQPDSTYYKNELQKALTSVIAEGDIPTIVVSSTGGFTKTLSINLESIPYIREYLNIVEAKLQGGK